MVAKPVMHVLGDPQYRNAPRPQTPRDMDVLQRHTFQFGSGPMKTQQNTSKMHSPTGKFVLHRKNSSKMTKRIKQAALVDVFQFGCGSWRCRCL